MHEIFARRYRGPRRLRERRLRVRPSCDVRRRAAVEVTLRLPPPLERPLEVRVERRRCRPARRRGGRRRGAGRDARCSSRRHRCRSAPPRRPARGGPACWEPEFRECYVCGERQERDGLEIYVGPVDGPGAAARRPVGRRATSAPEIVWAAIDCPGAYASGAEGRGDGRPRPHDCARRSGSGRRRDVCRRRPGRSARTAASSSPAPRSSPRTASCSRSRSRSGSSRVERLARRQRDEETPVVVVRRGRSRPSPASRGLPASATRAPARACARPTPARPRSATRRRARAPRRSRGP